MATRINKQGVWGFSKLNAADRTTTDTFGTIFSRTMGGPVVPQAHGPIPLFEQDGVLYSQALGQAPSVVQSGMLDVIWTPAEVTFDNSVIKYTGLPDSPNGPPSIYRFGFPAIAAAQAAGVLQYTTEQLSGTTAVVQVPLHVRFQDYGIPLSAGSGIIEYARSSQLMRSLGGVPPHDGYAIVQSNGKRILHQADLITSYPPVRVQTAGLDGFLISISNTVADFRGGVIKAGIHYLSMTELLKAPAVGWPQSTQFVTLPGDVVRIVTAMPPLELVFDYTNIMEPGVLSTYPTWMTLIRDTLWIAEVSQHSAFHCRVSKINLPSRAYQSFSRFGVGSSDTQFCRPVNVIGLDAFSGINGGAEYVLALTLTNDPDVGLTNTPTLYGVDPTSGQTFVLATLDYSDYPPAGTNVLLPNQTPEAGLFRYGRDPAGREIFTSYSPRIPTDQPGAAVDQWFIEPLPGAEGPFTLCTGSSLLPPDPVITTGPTAPVEPAPSPPPLPGDPAQPPDNTASRDAIPGEPPPPEPVGVPTVADRDLPTSFKKFIPYAAKWTSKTFNDEKHVLYGTNGRLRGLIAQPNASNTAVAISAPGSLIVRGIVCWIQTAPAAVSVPSLTPPLALVADTVDADESTPVTYSIVQYNPVLLADKAILATTDSTGFIWTPTQGLGMDEIVALAGAKQLSDDDVRLLTSQDGNIDAADTEHTHRGLMRDRKAFETIFNFDFDKVPPVPLGREPLPADEYHTHENLPTDREIQLLTSRGGVDSADEQHTHNNLPSNDAFSAVFGGPTSDASNFHTHEALTRAHGNVANPRATIWYVPQNVGNGTGSINATQSQFTGSVILMLGSSGGPVINRVVGIKYKEFARFYYDTVTAAIGGNPSVGTPAVEVIENFDASNPNGIVDLVPFNQEFTWRGIKFKVTQPTVGIVPFTGPTVNDSTGDFFTYHGVIATTTPSSTDGQPNCTPTGLLAAGASTRQVKMHERLLSYAAIRLVPVLDPRFPEGGYFTMAYI